jgi:hypothetical protein
MTGNQTKKSKFNGKTTVELLSELRNNNEKRITFFRMQILVFVLLLLVDINMIIFLRTNSMGWIEWLGIWSIICLIGFSVWQYKDSFNTQSAIDSWYLEKIMEIQTRIPDDEEETKNEPETKIP